MTNLNLSFPNASRIITVVCLMLMGSNFSFAGDTLRTGFENPPASAKARTWWHWMNGNVSRSGISADLEAMKQVGIQEAQIFNVNLNFPQGSATYLSPEWLDLFKFAATEAGRLGLELAFHNGAGWSSSGGPWITPENAMQTVVYSETSVKGGQRFTGKLPQPETTLDYYKDITVLAFPKPQHNVKIDGLDYKNLSGRVRNHLVPDTKEIPAGALISQSDIVDLSQKVSADGLLDWQVPEGEWIIMRLGHTPTGKKNHPAVTGGTGLECDKMSKQAVDAFWEGGIQPIIDKLDTLVGSVVNNCLIDSYEVGPNNWTAGFEDEFKRLRGYDCTAYLPTLAGYYVDGGEITERFLWDFRRSVGDLMAENYYAYFGELCHKNGMKFSVEPYWGPFDNMQVGATGDIVMCEFWSGGFPFFDSPKFVSSIAHLNGSSIVGAEAFTGIGGWSKHPAMVKSVGDQAWAQGINRFIFHTYVHQPWDVGPGLAMGVYGMDFNRLNTWWAQGKPFMDYIARSQFMLQQGKSVADVLVFTGESSPNNALLVPEIKAMGYDYDLIGVNKITSLTVEDGLISTPAGDTYKVLMLPKTDWTRPETLLKIVQLANAGATIIGSRPQKSPSLKDYPECDEQVKALADQLWETQLIKEQSIIDFLSTDHNTPDFSIEHGDGSDISFIHRKTDEADIYFIANASKESRQESFRLRITGKQPELWNAETGKIKDIAVWQENEDGTTTVPIPFSPEQAVFIVFRKPNTPAEHITESEVSVKKPALHPLSNLKIITAEYGTFLQEGITDVTDSVAANVKDGKLDIIANRQLCDCDPAMGYKKEFRLEYEIGGSVRQIYVMEKEPVKLDAGNGGELKIIKAVFGKFKPETRGVPKYYPIHDVTDTVKAMVSAGILEFLIDDQLVNGKPVAGDHKALRITYSTDGEEHIQYVPEQSQLNLTRDTPEPALISDNGEVKWMTPYPGELTYSTSSGNTNTIRVESVPKPIDLTEAWDLTFTSAQGVSVKETVNGLTSWSTSPNETLRYFSGTATYKKQFILPKNLLQPDNSLELDLGSVAVIAEVIVNGKELGTLWKVPFRISLDGAVNVGTNNLEVRITNLWPNRLIGDEQLSKDYGGKGANVREWPEWLSGQEKRPSERVTFASFKHWKKDSQLQTSGLLGPVVIRPYVYARVKR